MPRTRAKLSEKQERILVQCQLMGLTTADMTQISNRLRALDKERAFISKVSEMSAGFTFTEKNKREFTITDSEGKIFEVKVSTKYNRQNWSSQMNDYAYVKIIKPGTRFKPREFKSYELTSRWEDIEIANVCPGGNKWIYRTMRDIKKGKFD